MTPAPRLHPQLEPVRFGEFLRDRHLITEEQWLAALAAHWSESRRDGRARRIGHVIAAHGYLPAARVELEAARFHAVEVVEVDAPDDLAPPVSGDL